MLNCSLLKKMAPWAAFSIDVGSPSTKWTETPFRMQKHLRNSRSLRSSVDFSELGHPKLVPARPPFLPLLATLVRQCPFSQASWSNRPSWTYMAQCRKLESSYPTLPPKDSAPRHSTGCHTKLRVCPLQGTQLRSSVPNPSRGFSHYDTPNKRMKGRWQANSTKPQNTKAEKPNPNRG